MRFFRKAGRKVRSARQFVRGLVDTDHPLLVHIIPIRRCNLDCGYCNEYDKTSTPVPIDVMQRADREARRPSARPSWRSAAASRCCIPSWTRSSATIRRHGMIAGLITNGYLLSPERIQRAESTRGSTTCRSASTTSSRTTSRRRASRLLDQKLRWLAEHARLPRQHQFGGRRRHRAIRRTRGSSPGGRASWASRPRRDHPRRIRPAEAARRRPSARSTTTWPGRTSSVGQIAQNLYSGIRGFQDNLVDGKPNTGGAARARATSISARTGSCTGARSSVERPASRSSATRSTTSAGSS